MWRLINIMLMLCCLTASAMAQRITAAEYFFNHDPGIGSAVPIEVQGEGKVRLEASIEVSTVPEGFNTLFFRFKDDKGLWSLAEGRLVYVERIPLPKDKNISTAEYFFDHDPGVGRGITVAASPDGTVVSQVGVEGLEEGFHSLFFRFKDNLGLWSLAEGRLVYVEKIPLPSNKVATGAEYFFDTDPGIGNGQSIAVGSNGTIQGEVETTGLQPGFHHLYVRIKDNAGQWSLAEGRMVFVNKIPELMDRSIVKAEYFFDKDPGLGQGKEITPDLNGSIITEIDAKGMSEGFHRLFVRFQDDSGMWGLASDRPFLVYDFQNTSLDLDDNGQATLSLNDILKTKNETFDYGTISLDKTLFDCSDIGKNEIKVNIINAQGEKVETTVLVSISDSTSPIIKLQNISIQLDDKGVAQISPGQIDIGTTDNCGIKELKLSQSNFTCNDLGENEVIFTAIDSNGNQSERNFKVIVEDKQSPVLKTKNFTLELDENGQGSINVSNIDDGTYDNCGLKEIRINKVDFTCQDIGDQIVEVTAEDKSGNLSKANVTIQVKDAAKPVIKARSIELNLDENGKVTITASDIDNGSTDNCGIKEMILSKSEFDCNNIGSNTILFKVIDLSGNESTQEVIVNISDSILPIVKVKNLELKLGESGTIEIDPSMINDGSYDNCGIASITLSKSIFSCGDIGENKVVFKVIDSAGNEAMAESTITITDEMAPVIKTKSNVIVKLGEDGKGQLLIEDVDDGSFDNCQIIEKSLSKTEFDLSDAGVVEVIYTIIDSSGNISTKSLNVTVDVVLSFVNPEFNLGNKVKLFPNPAKNVVNLAYEKAIDEQLRQLEIVDMNGRVVLVISDFDRSKNYISLDVSKFPSGAYLLRLISIREVRIIRFDITR